MVTGRPFKCPNCGNWYTPIPEFKGQCRGCVMGLHSPHIRTGIIDCHSGQESSTYSEIKMTETLETIRAARNGAQAMVRAIREALADDQVSELALQAEKVFSGAEKTHGGVPDFLRWAGVFELPGQSDQPGATRYKDMGAMEELVGMNRRPPEDVATLKRSVTICGEIAEEIASAVAEARVAIGEVRRAAQNWDGNRLSVTAARVVEDEEKSPTITIGKKRQRTPNQIANAERVRQAAAARRAGRVAQPTA